MASLLPFTAAPHRGVRGSFFTPQRPRNEFAPLDSELSDGELLEERINCTGNVREIRYRGRGGELDEDHPQPLLWVSTYLKHRKKSYIAQVERVLRQPNFPAVNIWLALSMNFRRPGESDIQLKNFTTDSKPVHDLTEARNRIQKAFLSLEKQVEEFMKKGSNWRVDKINESSIHITKVDRGIARHSVVHTYTNLSNQRVGVHFPLPKWVADKRCTVNPHNEYDDYCLAYCLEIAWEEKLLVEGGLTSSSLTKERKNLNYRAKYPASTWAVDNWRFTYPPGVTFPVQMADLQKIEKANADKHLALFVMTPGGDKEEGLSYAYQSKYKGTTPWKVFLLVDFHRKEFRRHFSFVRDMQKLARKDEHDNFRCFNCFQGFQRAKQIQLHQEDRHCMRHEGMKTVFPTPEEAFYAFKNIRKKCPVDVVIVIDFECILQKRGDEEHKIQRHVPSQVAVLSTRTFGTEEQKNDYRFNIYTGDASDFSTNDKGELESRVGEMCVELVIRQRDYWIQKLRAMDYPIKMTPESTKRFNEETHCYGCGLPFDLPYTPVWMQGKPNKKFKKKSEEDKDEDEEMKDVSDEEEEECDEETVLLNNPTMKVRDHDHRIEKDNFRHAMHQFCNLQYNTGWRYNKKTKRREPTWAYVIPVLLHNFKGYDSHLILSSLQSVKGVRIIPQQGESILSISFMNLQFLDSLSFLQSTLDSAVKNLVKSSPNDESLRQNFSHLVKYAEYKGIYMKDDRFAMLLRKGEFPYEYVDDPAKFNDTCLPRQSKFFSQLTGKNIEKEDYLHAVNFWHKFKCETLKDYAEWYLILDVFLLMACVLKMRNTCLEDYGLEPLRYVSAPSLSFDACFLQAQTNLMKMEIPTSASDLAREQMAIYADKPFQIALFNNSVAQRSMYEFCENNKRGGITMVPGRYSRARSGAGTKEGVDIAYIDATNLYGWAMSQKLPVGEYEWWGKGQWDLDNVFHKDMHIWSNSQDPDMPTSGWWVECDLEIPPELHDKFKDYPPAPTKRVVKKEELSPYQTSLLEELDQKHDNKTEKLILDLLPKKQYGGHLRLLQLWMKLGVRVTKVHRVLKFKQYQWMKSYIDGNTERRKNTDDAAKKDFYKLMNNSCYGKFLQDDRKHRNIHVVTSQETKREAKLLNSPFFESADIIREDITLIHHRKKHVDLNKPVLVGVSILELSKLRMYEMWYLTLKECFGDRLKLLMTDTDSFVFEVKRHPDRPHQCWIEELVRAGYHDEFDLSVYPDNHPAVKAMIELGLDPKKNKGVLGKFKDESPEDPIQEFIGLRPKMYAYRTRKGKTNTRAKGVKRSVKDAEMDFTMYAKALLNESVVVQRKCEMLGIRSISHQLHTYKVNKKLISPTDSKLWVLSPFDTLPYGHYMANESNEFLWEMPSQCSLPEDLGPNTNCTIEHQILAQDGDYRNRRCLYCRTMPRPKKRDVAKEEDLELD